MLVCVFVLGCMFVCVRFRVNIICRFVRVGAWLGLCVLSFFVCLFVALVVGLLICFCVCVVVFVFVGVCVLVCVRGCAIVCL